MAQIQTKFTPMGGQGHIPPYDPDATLEEQVHQSVELSLKHFAVEGSDPYLDCLVLHSPMPDHCDTLRIWKVLETFAPKRIRNLGISNITIQKLQALCTGVTVRPSVVQNRLYSTNEYDRELRSWCRERGIVYQSFWTLTANQTMLHRRPVIALAERLKIEREEAFFTLVLGLGGVSVLTGTKTADRMRGDLAGVEKVGVWAQKDGRSEWDRLLQDFKLLVGDAEDVDV